MDKKNANGFPTKASDTESQRKQLPYSVETPYGFHLDLDFLKYVDDIEKGNTIKKLHIQRKNRGPKYSTLPRNFSLPGHGTRPAIKDTWVNTSTLGSKPKSTRVSEAQQIFEFRASDSSNSSPTSHSRVQKSSHTSSPKAGDETQTPALDEQPLGLLVRPHLFRASSMPVTFSHKKGLDTDEQNSHIQGSQHENESDEKPLRTANVGDQRGSIPQDRASLHRQITAALKRVRELEEQVRTIPELKAQICILQEERGQLLKKLETQPVRETSFEKGAEEGGEPQFGASEKSGLPSAPDQTDATCPAKGTRPDNQIWEQVQNSKLASEHGVTSNLLEQESEEVGETSEGVSGKESAPAPIPVPVILIEKAEETSLTSLSPNEQKKSVGQDFEHQREESTGISEQVIKKQEETLEMSLKEKQMELSGAFSTFEQSDISEYEVSGEILTRVEKDDEKTASKGPTQMDKQEHITIQELQAKIKTLEEKLNLASGVLERTNALLKEQVEENRLKDEKIRQLNKKANVCAQDTSVHSGKCEIEVPHIIKPPSEPVMTCDASVSTDQKCLSEKGVSTDEKPQTADSPKFTNLACSSTQTNVVEAHDIEVLAQVTTAEKNVGEVIVMCDQAVDTDFQGASGNATVEDKALQQTMNLEVSQDKMGFKDGVKEDVERVARVEEDKITENIIVYGEIEQRCIGDVSVWNLPKASYVTKTIATEIMVEENLTLESVVKENLDKETVVSSPAQQDQKESEPQPERPTEAPASPAAIGQVVNRIQGLLSEQWASLGSGGQDVSSSQKQPALKISTIQSHLKGSLSALSAFYSPVQKTRETQQSGLKSIMKKNVCPDKQDNGGAKKNLKFVGVNGGYESTSSEESSEEENQVEDMDSSESEEKQGEEGVKALEEKGGPGEQSEEAKAEGMEKPGEATDLQAGLSPQDEQPISEVVDKNFMAACHYLKDRMPEVSTPNKEMRQVLMMLYQEWFRVSSQKDSKADTVTLYLKEVGNHTPTLLRYIINLADGNGNMALHYSVSHSNFAVVKLLLDTGLCEVDQQNKAGYTAIMLAALTAAEGPEDMNVAQQLLREGNVNACATQSGQTALMLAVSHGRMAMVQVLLDCQADVNIQDRDGSTALMCACEHGHTDIAKLLLDRPDCDISLTDKDGHTALSIAMQANHSDIVGLLQTHTGGTGTSTSPL
ncbi:KN motif and ankyrin repeat domain-containing protein 1 [Chanos chanos]|uniref:KN motif and ankyrin repeat domain-containing protein 1 n=1 Tax=Chanos chanos TaxID=29144 RepID=A0A6J2WSA7_CHACN|nr:KN motif and ankyrin repeat domain-containing protein 4 [Chanos chanos]